MVKGSKNEIGKGFSKKDLRDWVNDIKAEKLAENEAVVKDSKAKEPELGK